MIHMLHDYAMPPEPIHLTDHGDGNVGGQGQIQGYQEEGQNFQDQWQSLWEEHYQVRFSSLKFVIVFFCQKYHSCFCLSCKRGMHHTLGRDSLEYSNFFL